VVSPVELGGSGLAQHANQCLLEGLGKSRLGEAFTTEFFEFIELKGTLLDHWPGGACLTHADFGGSNILIDGAQVRAVLDWEFAFSGNPAFDFGNLLRADFGPHFADALAQSYCQAGGHLPTDWRRISLMADLYSWLDFLNRPTAGAALIADAERIMRATMRQC
jgi:aminoglycoside phosphotransferase (APT) family kinase protein